MKRAAYFLGVSGVHLLAVLWLNSYQMYETPHLSVAGTLAVELLLWPVFLFSEIQQLVSGPYVQIRLGLLPSLMLNSVVWSAAFCCLWRIMIECRRALTQGPV